MKRCLFFALLFLATLPAFSQDDLFGTNSKKMVARKGWIINPAANIDMPAADMAKDFGINYRLGGSILYKTKSNWMFGVKGDFLTGDKIKIKPFLSNIQTPDGNFLTSNGELVGIPVYERGYLIGPEFGRIFNTSKKLEDNGILWLMSVGFIQHKLDIYVRNHDIPQLYGTYLRGYDRLTNGAYVEEFCGYSYFAKDGLLNFNLGLDVVAGITKDRRGYLYDLNTPDTKQHFDMLFGIRGGWYIPLFKRKSEEFYFE
ncbi:MAG TPA: hypothetical protein VN721_03060 [Flavipsychrobacter sp.]|nr:hypothetical protein [Flavipsychrobacter sp.]